MKKNFYKLLILVFAFTFFNCNNNEKQEEIAVVNSEIDLSIQKNKFNAQNVFNSLPDRKVVLRLIEENKIEYTPELLNDPTLVKRYTIETFKALNLGIYGSDLSIASSFDQTQESLVFLKCVNVLAGNLGVSTAFDQNMFDRIESNDNNKDSIIEIVTDAFRKMDEILKTNKRPATSAIILSGCWIEGLYVSCQIAQKVNTENLIKTILDQKEALKNLIVLLEGVSLEENAKFILTDLKSIYEQFDIAETKKVFNKNTIQQITLKIAALRKAIVADKV